MQSHILSAQHQRNHGTVQTQTSTTSHDQSGTQGTRHSGTGAGHHPDHQAADEDQTAVRTLRWLQLGAGGARTSSAGVQVFGLRLPSGVKPATPARPPGVPFWPPRWRPGRIVGGLEKVCPMGSAERIQTFILIGLAGVFILLAIGLEINWLTGHEAHRSLILMILGGLLLCASLIWIRHAQRPPR